MVVKPVTFDNGDLRLISAGELDPAVLSVSVILANGSRPFTAPIAGVTPVADSDLATKGSVTAAIKAQSWQGFVASATAAVQPGSPSAGARYILPVGATGASWTGNDKKIAEWSGSAWSYTVPVAGMVSYVADTDKLVRYATTWVDVSTIVDHEQLKNIQGGTTNERYHLTAAQYAVLNGSKSARNVVIAPSGGGALAVRALDGADVQTGQVAAARGGTGIDTSGSTGYPRVSGGTWSISGTIPWSAVSGAPSAYTPSAHAVSHAAGGTDALSLDTAQLTSGVLVRARGGLGVNASSVPSRQFYAGPIGGGVPGFRVIQPDDITGPTGPGQVLRRNNTNTANEWATVDALSLGVVSTGTTISTPDYLSGGGSLATNLSLDWIGVDVQSSGTLVARRPVLNFIGATVSDNSANGRIDITVTGGGSTSGLDPIVAALIFGG